jgi:hypothetical protein
MAGRDQAAGEGQAHRGEAEVGQTPADRARQSQHRRSGQAGRPPRRGHAQGRGGQPVHRRPAWLHSELGVVRDGCVVPYVAGSILDARAAAQSRSPVVAGRALAGDALHGGRGACLPVMPVAGESSSGHIKTPRARAPEDLPDTANLFGQMPMQPMVDEVLPWSSPFVHFHLLHWHGHCPCRTPPRTTPTTA